MEIRGDEYLKKADRLCDEFRGLFACDEGIRINIPKKKASIKLFGIDDSVRIHDIIKAISEGENCEVKDISCGAIRFVRGDLGTTIALHCPVEAALRIFKMNSLRIG